jgi:hypothetical protein
MVGPEAPDVHDVFISYHSGDATWVTELVADLKSRGVTVWLDQEQIRPGDRFVEVLEEALARVRCVVAVVSAGSLRSGWVQEEMHRALALINQGGGGERRLIAVLIDQTEPPGFLANRRWVDFRDAADRPRSLDQLLFGITGQAPDATGPGPRSEALHRDSSGVPAPGAIDEVEFLSRQIERARVDVRKLRQARLLALVPGLIIFGIFWAIAHAPPGVALAGVLVGAPLVTALVAWSATHAPLTLHERTLQKYEVFRDGLQLCQERTNPGCKSLRQRFWELVLHQTGASERTAASRGED